ncbi:MAG: glycoside hydrolase family 88 protein [Spirochaetales bacterium]|nr:glycoside hydrolase family 88 protein [Spirochaetales bacterium]
MKDINQIFSMTDDYIGDILRRASPEYPVWNQEMIRHNSKTSWTYVDGCMMTAFMNLYDFTAEQKYLEFCDRFIDYFVREDGSILSYNRDEYNLDLIKEGSVLFKLYDYTGKEKYRRAMDTLYGQLKVQPRTTEGNFWHKQIYPHQIWLDGLYMAQPFYLEYEKRYNGKRNYKDILCQFQTVSALMKDKVSGLYYHAYDSSKKMFWCDPVSGLSPHFWLRAIGWYVMALVDILEILNQEEDKEFYSFMSREFSELLESLLSYQEKSGMWYQLVDKGGHKGNYLETSGTAILSYAVLKAVFMGVLPESFYSAGRKAFLGICEKYLHRDKQGVLTLGGICLVAGLGGEQKRDGSFDYYMSEPVVENEAKGIAPFLLAYIYLKELNK